METMSTRYDASLVEAKWYERWEQAGLFTPDPDPAKPRFTITIPPPNITGSLHMGHALCYPLQDVYGRFHRLLGKSVLVLPGQDHAGIATQGVVEKLLRKEGTSGAQIGRQKFEQRVWEWRDESGGLILGQLRALGCAFDWSRQRFTLDEAYARAVLKVFVDWFDRGLIYRGRRVVNWDPALKTSVSDIETERKTIQGNLYYIRYPFASGTGSITIATTRPETMLADVAVAVHPSDKRYSALIGHTLILPLVGREIPLIADQYPDPEFGSGAVKITPAHDPNDYEVGIRHGLAMPVLITEDGRIAQEGGAYAGLDRFEARKRIVADLESHGFLESIEDREIPVLVSERSGEIIEPLLSEQWFVKQSELVARSIEAVEKGEVSFAPGRYEEIFLDWMRNIRDWCISRQLWWGHRIPVFYDAEGTPYAALNHSEAEAKAGRPIVRQDDDVLDTWFSSGLWPFATLGWPEPTNDLRERYPTDLLITDRNIINLWVARMMMMGFDQAGARPFGQVMIYATVLNEQGRRMSKSLGTGVDPMGVIEKVGADALRYTLFSQTGENQDIRYSEKRTEEARNFCNKIWNASRFVLLNAPSGMPPAPASLEPVDRWILSRLASTEAKVREGYESYNLQTACQALYKFFWSDYCDWYIEICKSRLMDEATAEAPRWVLLTCLDAFLRLLHPIMPHLSEEVHANLPQSKGAFLMSAAWPKNLITYSDSDVVDRALDLVREFRALRAELGITPREVLPIAYYTGAIEGVDDIVRSQAWVAELKRGRPQGSRTFSISSRGVELFLPAENIADVARLRETTERGIEKAKAERLKLEQRLADPAFKERASSEVVETTQAQFAEASNRIEMLALRLAVLEG